MNQDEIIEYVRKNGPILPAHLGKEIGQPILISSAILSELVDGKKLKLSHLKVGGSPLYYYPGHENKLYDHIKSLNEKDRRTVELIKKEKVLNEEEVDPLVRVSLKAIRDFATPLDVQYQGRNHRFWKWSLMDNKEAEQILREKLKVPAKEIKAKPTEQKTLATSTKQETHKTEEPKKEKPVKKPQPKKTEDDHFLAKVERYLERNDIEAVSREIVRKRYEVDLIVKVPSTVGRLTYYCKAKQKKRCTDSDLSAAYVQGEVKKLPVIFLCTGDLTKKAKAMQDTTFANMSIRKI